MARDESIYNKWYIEIVPEENCPPPPVRVGVRVSFRVWGIFLGGNCPRTIINEVSNDCMLLSCHIRVSE